MQMLLIALYRIGIHFPVCFLQNESPQTDLEAYFLLPTNPRMEKNKQPDIINVL